MKKSLSFLLILLMVIGAFAGCSEDEEKNDTKEKGPSDEEFIEDVLNNTVDAIREFDVEKASLYILDGSELEEGLIAVPEEIDKGFEQVNKNVAKILDENIIFRIVGGDTKKSIKKSVSDGLADGKQALIDSAEIVYGTPTVEGDTASVELTVKVGGKKFLPLLNGGNMDTAMNILMDYVDVLLKEDKYKGQSMYSLVGKLEEAVPDIIDLVVDDIRNGEKEEGKLTVYLEKLDGEWLITEIK